MNTAAFQLARICLVLALVCVAAALATPKGRLPLALRGILKTLHRDGTVPSASAPTGAGRVSPVKRLLSFVLVLLAVLLALA